MARADLHVHSLHSGHTGDPILRALGARECYTTPEMVYQQAMRKGMAFVTITDHDCIDGTMELHARHPNQTFTGVECTVSFPHEDCKLHVLVYGLEAAEFATLNRLRGDIYQFCDYLNERQLAHVLAHPLLRMGSELSMEHLEKLVLLFDVFEGINGSQTAAQNLAWTQYLHSLTPQRIEALTARHHIQPHSAEPWRKTVTGGSDDHTGLFIANTYTEAEARTPAEFVQAIRRQRTVAGGSHGTYQDMALSFFKVAVEYGASRTRGALTQRMIRRVAAHAFEGQALGALDHLQLDVLNWLARHSQPDPARSLLLDLTRRLTAIPPQASDRSQAVYDCLAQAADDYLRTSLNRLQDAFTGDQERQPWQELSAQALGLALSAPFYAALGVMNSDRSLIHRCQHETGLNEPQLPRRVAWFSDEPPAHILPPDLPDQQFVLVTPHASEQIHHISLPLVGELHLPDRQEALRIPSPLRALQIINALQPEAIYIETPGPTGALGLLLARLIHLPVMGIHVTIDGAVPADHAPWPEAYQRWFDTLLDQVLTVNLYRQSIPLFGEQAHNLSLPLVLD